MKDFLLTLSYYKLINILILLFLIVKLVRRENFYVIIAVFLFFNLLILSNLLPNYLAYSIEKKYATTLDTTLRGKKYCLFVFGGGSVKRFEKALEVYPMCSSESIFLMSTLKLDSLQKIKKVKSLGVKNQLIDTSIRGKNTFLEIKKFSKKHPQSTSIIAISEPFHLQRIEKLFNGFGYKNVIYLASDRKTTKPITIKWFDSNSIWLFDQYLVAKIKLLNYYIFQHH